MAKAAYILGIDAPLNAVAGELINVAALLENINSTYHYLMATGQFDSTVITFSPEYLLAAPAEQVVFMGSFTMPNKSVRITVWGWYYDYINSVWVKEESKYIDIALLMPSFENFAITDYTT